MTEGNDCRSASTATLNRLRRVHGQLRWRDRHDGAGPYLPTSRQLACRLKKRWTGRALRSSRRPAHLHPGSRTPSGPTGPPSVADSGPSSSASPDPKERDRNDNVPSSQSAKVCGKTTDGRAAGNTSPRCGAVPPGSGAMAATTADQAANRHPPSGAGCAGGHQYGVELAEPGDIVGKVPVGQELLGQPQRPLSYRAVFWASGQVEIEHADVGGVHPDGAGADRGAGSGTSGHGPPGSW